MVVTVVLTIAVVLVIFYALYSYSMADTRLNKSYLDEAEERLRLSLTVRRIDDDNGRYRLILDSDRRMLHYLTLADPARGKVEATVISEPYENISDCYLYVDESLKHINSAGKQFAGAAVEQLLGGTKGAVAGSLLATNFEGTRMVSRVSVTVCFYNPAIPRIVIDCFDAERDAEKPRVTASGLIGSTAVNQGKAIEKAIKDIFAE